MYLNDWSRDFRYALRALGRDASWTTAAVVIVALGVAASSTVFSVVNALLLRPLPFDDPDRLVWIANGEAENLGSPTRASGTASTATWPCSTPNAPCMPRSRG
jgi:putative ABC transport system permease protein